MCGANRLVLISVRSDYEPIKSVSDIIKEINNRMKDGFIVAYFDNGVLIGKFKNGSFTFYNNLSIKDEQRYIQRIRVFNEKEELLIWRTEQGFKGRYRKDGDGTEHHVIDAKQILWGTKVEKLSDDFIKIYEDRGTELILPLSGIATLDEKRRIALKTRNYIGYLPTQQATYIDCRFMGFEYLNEE